MPRVKQIKNNHSSLTGVGGVKYITQPATSVSMVKGDVVIAPNIPYKRRFC